MRRSLAALALACLTGCAMTSQEIRSEGTPYTVKRAQQAAAAAQCLARNAQEDAGVFTRVDDLPDSWSVTFIQPGFGALGVADIAKNRAEIVFRFRTGVPSVEYRFVEPWSKGC